MEAARPPGHSVLWLRPGLIMRDAISGQGYRVVRFLGKGGFGAAYQAVRLSGTNSFPDTCVLKVTIDGPTWHREAYFGHLLRHVPGLVEVFDTFAWAPRERSRAPLYCLVSEYVEQGDLGGYLERESGTLAGGSGTTRNHPLAPSSHEDS